jgi:hypothetical protein
MAWWGVESRHATVTDVRADPFFLWPSRPLENTVRYLGVDVADALTLAERTEI